MSDLDKLQDAFLKADALAQQGDARAAEDARMFAAEIKRIQASGGAEPQGDRLMPQLNTGIAATLGAPVDIVNRLPSVLNILPGEQGFSTFSDYPIGGSASIADFFGLMGADAEEPPPQTLMGQAFRGTGEAAGMLIPGTLGARALSTTGGTAGAVGQRLLEPTMRAPVASMGTELTAGAGARVGGELASRATEGDYGDIARVPGELAGAMFGAMAPGGLARMATGAVTKTPVLGTAIRAAKAAVVPFTEAGGRVRASDRLRGLSADPEGQAAALEAESLSGLSPAMQTGDPNLMALERSILERNPALRDQFTETRRKSSETLRSIAREGAGQYGVADTRAFIEKRRADFMTGLQARIDEARNAASAAVERLAPQREPGTNSAIVRRELETAYDNANDVERGLWGAVPRDVKVPVSAARRAFAEIDLDTPRAQKSDIYGDARRFLAAGGEFADAETVREMHGLYNRLRRDAREAISGPVPNENRARISNRLAEAIWEDLTSTVDGVPPAVANQLNEAREFTRAMNEVFSQGSVGEILSLTRAGGNRIAPEMTLTTGVGRGGTAAAVASDEIRRAIDYPAPFPLAQDAVRDATTDFLRSGVQRTAMPGGRDFSPQAGQRFAEQNREVLDRYPQLRSQLDQAVSATRAAERTGERLGGIAKAAQDPRQSVSASIATSRPGTEIERTIFGAKDPVSAAREVARQAARDKTGVATRGLEGGFVDYLMSKARTGTADASGNPVISGNNLVEFLRDPKNRAIAATIMGPEKVGRLDRIAKEFQAINQSEAAGSLTAPIEDMPNRIISLVAGTMAARTGAQLGKGTSGASLRTANLATQAVNRALGSLTNDKAEALLRDAIQDRELFRALLLPMNTPARVKQTESRLIEWARGYTATQMGEE